MLDCAHRMYARSWPESHCSAHAQAARACVDAASGWPRSKQL
ncbi:DUF982 domain-containing protein [Kitasatospora aureofaciens]